MSKFGPVLARFHLFTRIVKSALAPVCRECGKPTAMGSRYCDECGRER